MAATGFNYGRATSEAGGWYLPTGKLGIFYSDQRVSWPSYVRSMLER